MQYPYEPMTKREADEFMAALADTILAQPPAVRDRLKLAIEGGLYDVKAAGPRAWVIDVRGIGELMVWRPSKGGQS